MPPPDFLKRNISAGARQHPVTPEQTAVIRRIRELAEVPGAPIS